MRRLFLLALLVSGCNNSCNNVGVARCVEHCERLGAMAHLSSIEDKGNFYCVCKWQMKDLPFVRQQLDK